MLSFIKPAFSRGGRKLAALIIAAVLLVSALPVMSVQALSGTANFSPTESNLSPKYWVTASASSNSDDAENALDGSADTAWLADKADSAKWFMVDLSGGYNAVRKTEVTFPDAATIYQYKLEGSANGTNWSLLADRSGNTRVAAGFTDVFQLDNLRYIKLTFLSSSNIGIKNIKVINYLRPDLSNGSDMSELTSSSTTNYYYNGTNTSDGHRGGNISGSTPALGNNIYGLVKDSGWSILRLRIWNSSSNPNSTTASCGPYVTRNMARYIMGAGLDLGIDLHYSDTWADPQHQAKPTAWGNLAFDSLVTTMNTWTYDMIKSLVDQDTVPEYVAVGNEISSGFMWGSEWNSIAGHGGSSGYNITQPGGGLLWNYWREDEVTPAQYQQYLTQMDRFLQLVNAGVEAVDKVNADCGTNIDTELHFAFNVVEGDNRVPIPESEQLPRLDELFRRLSTSLKENGNSVDRIGISYYPDWHGSLAHLEDNIKVIRSYMPDVKINISECSPPNSGSRNDANRGSYTATVQTQGEDIATIMKIVSDIPNNLGVGVLTWGGSGSYQYGPVNFTTSGNPRQPYASIKVYKDAFPTNVVESGVYVTTQTGVAPVLPSTVKEIDAVTGVIKDSAVTWGNVSAGSYATAGTFQVTGTVTTTGNMNAVTAYVTVVDYREPSYSVDFIKYIAGGMEATFSIDNVFGDEDLSAIGYVAVYDAKGRLVSVQDALVDAGVGEAKSESIQLGDQPAEYTVKAFFWDADTYIPVCDVTYPVEEVLPPFVPVIENATNVPSGYYYQTHNAPISVAPIPALEGRENEFICGADLSSLAIVVDCGAKFTDLSGQKMIEDDEISNCLAIMKKYGLNWVRLRIWNDVSDFPSGITDGQGPGGKNDLAQDLRIATRAKALGLKILLDYHYSDTWADPGRQIKPRAWTNLTQPELENAVYTYTRDTLQAFKDAGCFPDMVQIGNEVNSGFLYNNLNAANTSWSAAPSSNTGNTSNEANYIAYTKAGIRAVREVDPNNGTAKQSKVMIHLANPESTTRLSTRAAMLQRNNVDYDVMGSSYYPWWHGTIANLTTVLNGIANTYGKEVCIAETGWEHMATTYRPSQNSGGPNLSRQVSSSEATGYALSPQGQADALRTISNVVANVPDNKGLGVFVWEPAWISTPQMGSGWAGKNSNIVVSNQAHFDSFGRALPSVNIWPRLFPAYNNYVAPTLTSFAAVNVNTSVGTAPTMPAQVTAIYSDGSTASVAVTWDSIASSQYASAGTFTVQGTVAGTSIRPSATVNVSASAGTNLLVDPGFENNNRTAINWSFPNAGTWYSSNAFNTTATYVRTGTRSVLVSNGGLGQRVALQAGRTYRLTAWVYYTATGGTAYNFGFNDGATSYPGDNRVQTISHTRAAPIDTWKQLTVTFTPTVSKDYVIYVWCATNAASYFDDFELVET
ncbi:MAG: glycosyl hydrolase 53 family protein [Oscillospiraceae bacterium]|nr:glycosyl hydrolase 53 family protein [Oscillospiraceae bacterium]